MTNRLKLEDKLDTMNELLHRQNLILGGISTHPIEPISGWKEVQMIVQSGLAEQYFSIGDQLFEKYTATDGRVFDFVWDVVRFGTSIILNNGIENEVPSMTLQSHYATLESIQFAHEQNEVATESTFLADMYYYKKNADGSYTKQNVVTGESIPSGETYYHSTINDPTGSVCQSGYNRWRDSAYRQWLNSDAPKGGWWNKQYNTDIAPGQLNNYKGFIAGHESEFIDILKPTKISTATNTITDGGVTDDTFDLFFLPSLEQIYVIPQVSGIEGEYWPYWKERVGTETPQAQYGTYPERTTHALESQSYPQSVRLRSPTNGYSRYVWNCNSAGHVNNYYAHTSYRCSPACVIC